jgi:serine phosphatase RsbU (regulator of sigma subunit)
VIFGFATLITDHEMIRLYLRRCLARLVIILLFFIVGTPAGFSELVPKHQILRLSSHIDQYYIGPYLFYLEDPEKKLTIAQVSSSQISDRFITHTRKKLNLGLNPYAYWIRFTIVAGEANVSNQTWLLSLGWPNLIDYATLYYRKSDDSGWSIKEVGRILPTGPDPHPSSPTTFLPPEHLVQPVTFYLRIVSSDTKLIPLEILTREAYQSRSQVRLLWFGVYYGIILSMSLYNLILFLSLREYNRLYYLFYLICMSIVFLGLNGLLQAYFHIGIGSVRNILFTSLCFVYFWACWFAKSFLITQRHTPFFDKLLSSCMILSLALAAVVSFTTKAWGAAAVNIVGLIIPPVVLLSAVTTLSRGFRPARFFLLAFAVLILSTIFEALVVFDVLPYLTRYTSQFASAIEVIFLQLALADRIKVLSQEQESIKQSLYLAREVQQNLLPHENPQIDWLDTAGKSIYCDETGGDYFDFIIDDDGKDKKIAVTIGDVSGHGIPAALLMAAVRSSLRQRLSLPGSTSDIMSDVNRQLVQDVEDSGQFITMFFLTIDPAERQVHWIRAGHDPAIFYDPGSDSFEELGGSGIALGVNEDWIFKEYTKRNLKKGQIIFLSTDGIWEARNSKGEMFGKEPIYNIIRSKSSLSSNEILDIIFESLNSFQNGCKVEDDVTLVIIKIAD